MSIASRAENRVQLPADRAVSRDAIWKGSVMVGLFAALFFSARALGLTLSAADFMQPAGLAGLLGAVGYFYTRFRPEPRFALCATALLQLSLFTLGYTLLMYATGTLGRPLVDEALVACDARLGVHLPAIVAWAGDHPRVAWLLSAAYGSVLPQTALVVTLLCFHGQRRELEGFIWQFMLGALLCLACFALWPAAGPFEAYGYPPDAVQERYLSHLHSLRDGARTALSWRGAEGLITFPSFHVIWAVILTFAVRRVRWALAAAVALNVAVIAATLTTGWHYATDLLAGAFAAAGLLWAVERMQRALDGRLSHAQRERRE